MGMLEGVKNAIKRAGSKRSKKEPSKARKRSPQRNGNGGTQDKTSPAEVEPEPDLDPDPDPNRDLAPSSQQHSEPALKRQTPQPAEQLGKDPKRPLSQQSLQVNQPPQPQKYSQVDIESESDSDSGDPNCCDEKELKPELEVESESESDAPAGHEVVQQVESPTVKTPVPSFRFPFQAGRESEDRQSVNSGFCVADKASSYRGSGRVDSHVAPAIRNKLNSGSIRAEVVNERRKTRDDLRLPTLRAQREHSPEPAVYHGIDELEVEDDEPLFQNSHRKCSVEPTSPTSPPSEDATKYHVPTAESEADSQSSGSASEAEYEQPASQQPRPRGSPMSTGPPTPSRIERMSTEWKGVSPSLFYPHLESPARNKFVQAERRTSYDSSKYSSVRSRAAHHSMDPREVSKRVNQDKHRVKESDQREREKDIIASRLAHLEYEKLQLAEQNLATEQRNSALSRQVASIAMQYSAQHKRLTQMEMSLRNKEGLRKTPKNKLRPELLGAASLGPTLEKPERIMAWAEAQAQEERDLLAPVHDFHGIRPNMQLPAKKSGADLYTMPNDSAATFGSSQHPLLRAREMVQGENQEVQPNSVPKQVQFSEMQKVRQSSRYRGPGTSPVSEMELLSDPAASHDNPKRTTQRDLPEFSNPWTQDDQVKAHVSPTRLLRQHSQPQITQPYAHEVVLPSRSHSQLLPGQSSSPLPHRSTSHCSVRPSNSHGSASARHHPHRHHQHTGPPPHVAGPTTIPRSLLPLIQQQQPQQPYSPLITDVFGGSHNGSRNDSGSGSGSRGSTDTPPRGAIPEPPRNNYTNPNPHSATNTTPAPGGLEPIRSPSRRHSHHLHSYQQLPHQAHHHHHQQLTYSSRLQATARHNLAQQELANAEAAARERGMRVEVVSPPAKLKKKAAPPSPKAKKPPPLVWEKSTAVGWDPVGDGEREEREEEEQRKRAREEERKRKELAELEERVLREMEERARERGIEEGLW